MHRKFISLVLASALAVSGLSAAPARADDTAKWIAGAAALAIIGLAIADQNNRNDKPVYTTPTTPGYPYSKVMPRQCVRTDYLQGRKIQGLGRGCLKQHNVNVAALPSQCAVKLQDPRTGNRRVIYAGRCMRDRGYILAQR